MTQIVYKNLVMILWLLLANFVLVSASDQMRIGIIEFDEKNSIGTENAGIVVPGILSTYFKKLGQYRLEERVYLKNVLQEQAMIQAGFINDNDAQEYGRINGVDAIIAGSVMRIGDRLIINARMVNVNTGHLIESGHVQFYNPEELEVKVEELAYLLHGFTTREYKTIKLRYALKTNRYGLRVGTGWAENRIQQWYETPQGYWLYRDYEQTATAGLNLEFFWQAEYFDIEAGGVVPNIVGILWAGANFYPTTHVGLAYRRLWLVNTVNDKDWEVGSFHYRSSLPGLAFRVSENFRFALYKGITHFEDSKLRFQDHQAKAPYIQLKQRFDFLDGPTMATVEYRIDDNWLFNATYFHNLEKSYKTADYTYSPDNSQKLDREITGFARMLLLNVGYSFAL
jgi:hypothetical protein